MKLAVEAPAPKLETSPEDAPSVSSTARRQHDPLLPYVGLRAAELVLRTVDRRTAYRLAAPLAAALTLCWPSHWRGLRANLRVVRPDLDRKALRLLLRANVRNFLKAWIDVLQMAHRPLEDWRELLELQDNHYLQEARDHGRGVIIASLHLGSWEAAIASLRDQFAFSEGGLALLAEQVRPLRCFDWLVRARRKVGCQVIPLNVDAVKAGDLEAVRHSGAAAVRQIFRLLSKQGVVVIAVDRDLLGTGEALPFFGHQASIPLGAVEIAARTGAPILPVSLLRQADDTYLARGFPPIVIEPSREGRDEVRRAARRLLQVLEPELRAHPDQWHVLNPLFGPPMAELEFAEMKALAGAGASAP